MTYYRSIFSGFSTGVPEGTLLQIAVVFLQEHFVSHSRSARINNS
jgi:hypothetical protein